MMSDWTVRSKGKEFYLPVHFLQLLDQMIELILLPPSENLRIPVKTQATALRGLVLNRDVFCAPKAFVQFCDRKDSLLFGHHCY